MKNLYLILLFSLLVVQLGCINEDLQPVLDQDQKDDQLIKDYITEKNLTANKDESGIYYEILQANPSGQFVEDNQVVSIYYKIGILNGKTLESRLSSTSSPLKFLYSNGGIIPEGINHGVGLMRIGEKFRFYIPSQLGLGSYYSYGYIGPNEVMVAEVELITAETLTEHVQWEVDSIKSYLASKNIIDYNEFNSGLHKYTIYPGSGYSPNLGRVVRVIMSRKYLNEAKTHTLNNSDTVNIYLPRSANDFHRDYSSATDGLKEGLLNMTEGEKAVLLVPSHLAFGGSLIIYKDSQNNVTYGGSVQILPQKFRTDYVQNYLQMQNILPLTVLKYELTLLNVY